MPAPIHATPRGVSYRGNLCPERTYTMATAKNCKASVSKSHKPAKANKPVTVSVAEKIAAARKALADAKAEATQAETAKATKAAAPIFKALSEAGHDANAIAAIATALRNIAKPAQSRGESGGSKAEILGHSTVSVLRWMGAKGYTKAEAKAVVAALSEGEPMADGTYGTAMSHGRNGIRSLPELTVEQVKALNKAAGRK